MKKGISIIVFMIAVVMAFAQQDQQPSSTASSKKQQVRTRPVADPNAPVSNSRTAVNPRHQRPVVSPAAANEPPSATRKADKK